MLIWQRTTCTETDDNKTKRSLGADVPSLGLSNKAVLEGDQSVPEVDKHVKDQYPDFYFKPDAYDKPPTEDTLVQNTLWPEIQKVKKQYAKVRSF